MTNKSISSMKKKTFPNYLLTITISFSHWNQRQNGLRPELKGPSPALCSHNLRELSENTRGQRKPVGLRKAQQDSDTWLTFNYLSPLKVFFSLGLAASYKILRTSLGSLFSALLWSNPKFFSPLSKFDLDPVSGSIFIQIKKVWARNGASLVF